MFKNIFKGAVSFIPAPFKPWEADSMSDYIQKSEDWAVGAVVDDTVGAEIAIPAHIIEGIGGGPYQSTITPNAPIFASGGIQQDTEKDSEHVDNTEPVREPTPQPKQKEPETKEDTRPSFTDEPVRDDHPVYATM